MASLQRLDQIAKPDDFDDQKSPASIALSETDSADFGAFLEYMLSQIKRIVHGDNAGNWHDDPVTVFGTDASLRSLLARVPDTANLDLLLITSDGGLIYDNSGNIAVKELP
jgi:hypothetical protein